MSDKFKRTHFMTNLSLQLRYILVTFIILVAFLAISMWMVYMVGWSPLMDKLSQVYPQGRLMEILRTIYFRLTMGFLCLLPVAVLLTILLSHTVAGPLVRIKRYLKLMAKGDFDLAPLVLRPYDELKDVADLINEITSGIGPRFRERKTLVKSLQQTVGELRNDLQRLPSAGQEVMRKVNYLADSIRVLE